MSLFNMAAGEDLMAGIVLRELGVTRDSLPRYRDAFFNMDDPENPTMVLMTRTGGPNRSEYIEENAALEVDFSDVRFIRTYDDDFDSTFAYFEYSLPESKKFNFTMFLNEGIRSGYVFEKPMERLKRLMEFSD